ncbi:hypothetical protein M569_13099, partial [Genlisea aurea]
MAVASPSAPSFYCTPHSGYRHARFSLPISVRAGRDFRSRILARPRIASRLNAASSDGGELVHELNHGRWRRGSFPVYVTLPIDAVGPNAQAMRRKKAMTQSFWALATAGVEGVVMEVWWGLVEGGFPGIYNWNGYLEIVELAQRFGLKVRALMAFHQCGSGPDDPFWIPLPLWVLEEMQEDPDIAFSDKFGRRSMEYISFGCDTIPVLNGRSPVQAYADMMKDFRDTFRPFLGGTITGIQVGLGPGGELRYPSCPTQKLAWAWHARELGEFQCYDKYMVACLNACAGKIGMKQWGNGGPNGASSLFQNPEYTEFFRSNGSWMSPYGEFFLGWYSEMLLLHGERICREAKAIFRGLEVSMTGKIAAVYWHYATRSHPSELTSGYYNTVLRDGFTPIVRMFGRHGFGIGCSCFDMADSEEKPRMITTSKPESFLKQVLLSAGAWDVPLEGSNYSSKMDDDSFGQVVKMSKLSPSCSFNLVRMDRNMFESRRWDSFVRFVRQMSAAGDVFRLRSEFG